MKGLLQTTRTETEGKPSLCQKYVPHNVIRKDIVEMEQEEKKIELE